MISITNVVPNCKLDPPQLATDCNPFISINLVTKVDPKKLRLSSGARHVLLLLANFAGSKKHCFPSVATLMQQSGLSRAPVFRALKELEMKSVIRRQARGGGPEKTKKNAKNPNSSDGKWDRQRSNIYHINTELLKSTASSPRYHAAISTPHPPQINTGEGLDSDPPLTLDKNPEKEFLEVLCEVAEQTCGLPKPSGLHSGLGKEVEENTEKKVVSFPTPIEEASSLVPEKAHAETKLEELEEEKEKEKSSAKRERELSWLEQSTKRVWENLPSRSRWAIMTGSVLTPKQKGQLNQFDKIVSTRALPGPDGKMASVTDLTFPGKVIRYLLAPNHYGRNWRDFTTAVECRTGTTVPAKPTGASIGFVLKYASYAVNAYLKHQESIAAEKAFKEQLAKMKAENIPLTMEEQLIRAAKAYSPYIEPEDVALIRAILARWPEDVATNADILRKYWCAPANDAVAEGYDKLVAALAMTEKPQAEATTAPLQEQSWEQDALLKPSSQDVIGGISYLKIAAAEEGGPHRQSWLEGKEVVAFAPEGAVATGKFVREWSGRQENDMFIVFPGP